MMPQSEEDVPVSRSCPSCNADQFRAERLDTWTMAYGTLTSKEWGEEYGPPCPADVLHLALFLDGASGND